MTGTHVDGEEHTRQEIERKYLLNKLPDIPAGAEIWKIEQGYFDDAAEGRIRRALLTDGSVVCTRTIKRGSGLIRDESECTISEDEFNRLWARTESRRLSKTRYRVRDSGGIWEVDQFQSVELILAEIELPSPDTQVKMPQWLNDCVVREVTNEPEYTNASIAFRRGVLK